MLKTDVLVKALRSTLNKINQKSIRISGLVVEYIVAIDVTHVRFPADAYFQPPGHCIPNTTTFDPGRSVVNAAWHSDSMLSRHRG